MNRETALPRILGYGSHIADRVASPQKEERRYPVRVRTTFVRLTRRGTDKAA